LTVDGSGNARIAPLTVYDSYTVSKTPTNLFNTVITLLDFSGQHQAVIQIGDKRQPSIRVSTRSP